MIEEGVEAPAFELPAVVGGDEESIALEEFLGREVVILAFYPGDFNPACDGESTDLDELDLFTMQKDVAVLGISGDSVHSHGAFADEYDLKVPLLSDTDGGVAEDYGVAVRDPSAGYSVHRAVVVVGPEGEVQYAWSTEDLHELPPVDRIREAVDEVGGAETALARYRVGHAHYVEGRRAFTSAMGNFQDNEWMMAQSDFKRAFDEFDEAADHFNTASRFATDDHDIGYYDLAEDKAELLWQAAEWLRDAASAYASGEGAEGQAMREDAEGTLEEARRFPEPPDPDEFPPEEPAPEPDEVVAEPETILPDDGEEVDTSLDVDLDEVAAHADDEVRQAVEDDAETTADESTATAEHPAGEEEEEAEDPIDDAELEEITAELEQQTEAAQVERAAAEAPADEADDVETAEDPDEGNEAEAAADADGTDASDGPPDEAEPAQGGDDAPEEDEDEHVELELTDPTDGEGLEPLEDEDEGEDEGEDEAEETAGGEDLSDGGHGVPDSL